MKIKMAFFDAKEYDICGRTCHGASSDFHSKNS